MDNDNGVKVEDMFAECDSPSLIEIYCNCDLKVRLFYDLIDGKTGHLYSEIIQVFDFISNELRVKTIFIGGAKGAEVHFELSKFYLLNL